VQRTRSVGWLASLVRYAVGTRGLMRLEAVREHRGDVDVRSSVYDRVRENTADAAACGSHGDGREGSQSGPRVEESTAGDVDGRSVAVGTRQGLDRAPATAPIHVVRKCSRGHKARRGSVWCAVPVRMPIEFMPAATW
jgi:hypothetical protein